MSPSNQANHDRLRISGLVVDCVVGIYPEERHAPQPLQVNVELGLDTRAASKSGHLDATVDYAKLCGELRFLLHAARFALLEEAAEGLARHIFTRAAPAHRLTLSLSKPRAIPGGAVPTIEITRYAGEYASMQLGIHPSEQPAEVYASQDCGIYRVWLGPQSAQLVSTPDAHHQAELALESGLLVDGQALPAGAACHWPAGYARRYANPTDTPVVLLGVYRPAQPPHLQAAQLPGQAQPSADQAPPPVEPQIYFQPKTLSRA